MSDDLFADFIQPTHSITPTESAPTGCLHTSIIESGDSLLCTECGEETGKTVVYDKEWRYYGHMDTKHKSDPTRCKARKIESKSIFKDVENIIYDDAVVMVANNYYTQITEGNIHRGDSRKGIVFACIYYAYKQLGKPQTCENLADLFKIDNKTSLKGLKHFGLKIKKGTIGPASHITPANLVSDIMDRFSATPEQKAEVVALYERIKNKSSKINRSRPQSVASGLAYYWICNNRKNSIGIKKFVGEIGLSELTVIRIAKEISMIIDGDTPRVSPHTES